MRRFKYLAVFAWLLLVTVRCSNAQDSVSDVVKKSADSVVLIVISNSSGEETALGSGFLVSSEGEIVTNYHVIKDAHSAIVKMSNGAFFPVKEYSHPIPTKTWQSLRCMAEPCLPLFGRHQHDQDGRPCGRDR